MLLKDTETSTDRTAPEFVLMLLHAVTNAHILHFQTRSYAQHMALGDFYAGLGDLVDEFVEAYQGKYGIIYPYPTDYDPPAEPVAYLNSLKTGVAQMRTRLPKDSELQNLVDEIASLIDSTLYKLRFLK